MVQRPWRVVEENELKSDAFSRFEMLEKLVMDASVNHELVAICAEFLGWMSYLVPDVIFRDVRPSFVSSDFLSCAALAAGRRTGDKEHKLMRFQH